MRNSMAFVLAGGRGSRLKELTDRRAKPAVYFGGKTRIVDFALSNALNSGIRKMAIATQYKAHSLIRHCQRGWSFFRAERNEYLDILPASQRMSETQWYRGTADAVAQNIDIIDSYDVEYVLILAGDHIYKMDYERMIRHHVESGADVTVGCLTVPRMEATAFGVMDVDAKDRITSFLEKPADPPGTPADPTIALASMGIYVFSWAFLRDLLLRDMEDPNSSHDFGTDLIPDIVKNGKASAHRFTDSCVRHAPDAPAYWRDVGTVDAFWKANCGPDRFHARTGPLGQELADLDLFGACRPPSSSMTRKTGAARPSVPWSRGLHHLGHRDPAGRSCSRWSTPTATPASIRRWCCLT
jgi:glucose-1-phosphate adenylyltransferase